MKLDKAYTFREFFATQTNHWFFFVVVLLFFSQLERSLTPWDIVGWGVIGVFPILLYQVRKHQQHILPMIFFHALAIFAAAFLPVSVNAVKGLYFFFAVLYVLFSLIRFLLNRFEPTNVVPLYFSLPVLFFVPIFESFRNPDFYYFAHCVLMALVAVLFLLTYYVDRYLLFIARNEETASSMPSGEIFSSGMQMTSLYLLLGSGVLFLISLLAVPAEIYRRFWLWVRDCFVAVVHFLFDWLLGMDREGNLGSAQSDFTFETGVLPDAGDSLFLRILEIAATIAVMAGLFLLIARLFFKLFRFLRNWQKVSPPEETLSETEDIHESLTPRAQKTVLSEEEGWLSVTQRIRRLYKKKIAGTLTDPRLFSRITAREFADWQENPLFAQVYEKARYSDQVCDKQDLKQMQHACRRRKTEKILTQTGEEK